MWKCMWATVSDTVAHMFSTCHAFRGCFYIAKAGTRVSITMLGERA